MLLALVKRHEGELLVTALHNELSFYKGFMDTWMGLWQIRHIFQEDRHPAGIVCVSKSKEPRAQVITGSQSQRPIAHSLTSNKAAVDQEIVSILVSSSRRLEYLQ